MNKNFSRKLTAFLCAALLICGSATAVWADESPKITVTKAKTGNSASITISDLTTQIYGVQLKLPVSNSSASYTFKCATDSAYSVLKESSSSSVTLYADAKQPLSSGGSLNLGTLSADKAFSVSGKADLILLDRSLNASEYKNLSVSSDGSSSDSGSGSGSGSGSSSSGNSSGSGTVVFPSAPATPTVEKKFNDVTGHWAENSISFVTSKGLFQGMSENEFMPNANMTRAMFVTVLQRFGTAIDGKWSLKAENPASFTDVSSSDWYANAVAWAGGSGVVSGMGDGSFEPNTEVTREQMAVMIVRFADLCGVQLPQAVQPVVFTDADNIQSWAVDAVSRAQQAGIIQGRPEGNFDPQATATRAEVATIMQRVAGK